MLSEDEILINKIAQSKLPIEDGLVWFRKSAPGEYRSIIAWISFYLSQTHPRQYLIYKWLDKTPIKSTMTPIVLFKTYPYKIAAQKVCDLPDHELEKAFLTLLTLFKYADTERRQVYCKNGCNHEWHNIDTTNSQKRVGFFARIKRYFG